MRSGVLILSEMNRCLLHRTRGLIERESRLTSVTFLYGRIREGSQGTKSLRRDRLVVVSQGTCKCRSRVSQGSPGEVVKVRKIIRHLVSDLVGDFYCSVREGRRQLRNEHLGRTS